MQDDIWGMTTGNPIRDKSFSFSLRIVKLYQHLTDKRKEFVLSKQVLRSGTSIGANIEEAHGAQSDSDFQAKISIAYKEALETAYWLRLLFAAKYITERQFKSIYPDCSELVKLTGSIQLSMRNKTNSKERSLNENNKTEKLEDSESSPISEQKRKRWHHENAIDFASHFMF